MNNSTAITNERQKPKFSVAISTPAYQKLIANTLGDSERCKRFVASISSAVATNPVLQECEASSIVCSALLGESLNLSPSPQLGQYYLVPFNDKKSGLKKAQFILGYKGLIQLAIRSGNYVKLNVLEIKEGELISFDPLNEEIECDLIDDFDVRSAAETIGYYAMFEYVNGFRKAIYWSKSKMMSHADKYSMAFSKEAYEKIQAGKVPDKDMWKYSSFWYKDFDGMAKKTMLRELISKWGIMSTEMMSGLDSDNSVAEMRDGKAEIINSSDFEVVQYDAPEGVTEKIETVPESDEIIEQVNLADL